MEHIKCQQEAGSAGQGICRVKRALSLLRQVKFPTVQQPEDVSSDLHPKYLILLMQRL